MSAIANETRPPQAPVLPPILAWSRVQVAFGVSLVPWIPLAFQWQNGPFSLLIRTTAIAMAGVIAFGLFERWPREMPKGVARWVLQLVGVGLVMPIVVFVIYVLSTKAGAPAFWHDNDRLEGFVGLTFIGMLLGPWTALAALVKQKDALARYQAMALELQRSEHERQQLDSRLRLLTAQVEPHFLFNTLANVRELVQAGSPQAPAVLESLIAYLRAAVPRLHGPASTVETELQLARAYLEVMHMRMPDRLQYTLQADDAALALRCPPMTLLTLVENAVRHGIDPSEVGGRIEVSVRLEGTRCRAQVRDTGVGLRKAAGSLGTGLTTLRERLQLVFGEGAKLTLTAIEPHGVLAEADFPATR